MFDKSLGNSDKSVRTKGQLHEGHKVKGIRFDVTMSHGNSNDYIHADSSERQGGRSITFIRTKDKPKC